MADMTTVVVGNRELLAPVQNWPDVTSGRIRVFPTDDIRTAVEAILDLKPQFLVLDQGFSATPRGAAMIDRLRADAGFETTQVLVVNGESVELLADESAEDQVQSTTDWRGSRRVPRIRIRAGVEVQVDGTTAQLIDLSTLGAQVVSSTALKPNQRVRLVLTGDAARLAATVAWASFELPKGRPLPQYRAGLEFVNPPQDVLQQFCVANAATAE